MIGITQISQGITSMTVTTITSKGQVTVPKSIRESLGLKAGSKVEFAVLEGGQIVLRKIGPRVKSDFAKRLDKVRGSFKSDLSTNEIMKILRGD